MNLSLNRTGIVYLQNKSGGVLAFGDVAVVDDANPLAITTTNVAGYVGSMIVVVLDPAGIADDAVGLCAYGGPVPQINLSASASLGDLIATASTPGEGTPHAGPFIRGDFAQVLQTGSSPQAILFPAPYISTNYIPPVFLSPWVYTSKVGTFVRLVDYLYNNSSGANGDYLEFDAYLAAGEYTFNVVYSNGSNGGLVDLTVDGDLVTQIDMYGGGTQDIQSVTTGFVIATGGLGKKIRLELNGKNPSSSGYYMFWSQMLITQTA